MSIASPIIGASNLQVWKPTGTVGSASDATAPFHLGMTLTCTPLAGSRNLAQFCRVGTAGVTSSGTAGIGTDGVTIAATTNNTWTNETGVALVAGDYVFLTAEAVTTP
jgi:hypothetical protein